MRIGFRSWNLRCDSEGKFQLMPLAYSSVGSWVIGGVTESICPIQASNHPKMGCGCGLYAWYELNSVDKLKVYGAVQCWGNIVGYGHQGFKASHARIIAVMKPEQSMYNPPEPPLLPATLLDNLYMVRWGESTLEQFRAAIYKLKQLEHILPTSISWRVPSDSQIRELWQNMQKKSAAVREIANEYQERTKQYQRRMINFSSEVSALFAEQMPFPIFEDSQAMVKWASQFGDLGPRK